MKHIHFVSGTVSNTSIWDDFLHSLIICIRVVVVLTLENVVSEAVEIDPSLLAYHEYAGKDPPAVTDIRQLVWAPIESS